MVLFTSFLRIILFSKVRDFKTYLKASNNNSQGNTPLQAFLAECQNQVVGIAVIRNEEVLCLFFLA